MAIKSSDQISIVDVTDAYSVVLTSEAHTFPGSTSAALAGSITTQVIALRGADQINASVVVSEITKPSGVTVSSDGNAKAPTLTIMVSTAVVSGGIIKIPVHIGDITITKEFSFAIAFKGATGAQGDKGDKGDKGDTGATGNGVKSTAVTYQASSSGTTIPTGTWSTSIPTVEAGKYLWTKTVITYTDGTTSASYCVGMMGATGATGEKGDTGATGKGVKSTAVTYQKSSSGTTAPTGTWASTVPSASAGEYIWSRTVITYTDNTTSTTYSVGMIGATGAKGDKGDTGEQGEKGDKGDKGDTGATGAAGADAITLSITSSNGTIFKNASIETVLTAHVYKAGVELTVSQIAALGTIKWYKDGGTSVVATGQTLTIDAGDVTNKATYIAQLEG